MFFRTYSRRLPQARETWAEVTRRTVEGLARLGQLRPDQVDLLRQQQAQLKALPAGRWLWIGGTPWVGRPENFSGAYNCTSTNLVDWDAFALMMDLAMMGCGTGAVIEPHHIQQLPPILNRLRVVRVTPIGQRPPRDRQETTTLRIQGSRASITVGDSRQGWVEAYRKLLCLASDGTLTAAAPLQITVDLGHVRPVGEPLKGFGGVANPVKLQDLFSRVATILNGALGRQLNSVECC
ncbi:MAG: hypothetical protein F4Y87_07765, partial [Synechococcus sp. SB0665_bin_28]|nr:hypothetical protein [Synechococcus sp. SB0665_bin_28]